MKIDAARELHLETFRQVFELEKPETFGHGREGRHDGNKGVQWNAWVGFDENGEFTGCVGVNLEGIRYNNDRPIARLIERELGSFALFRVMTDVDRREGVIVRWSRDAWPRNDVPYDQYLIVRKRPTELTRALWQSKLVEAPGCLDRESGFQRCVQQPITRKGVTKNLYVSPHLQFVRELWRGKPQSETALIELMQEARRQLLPIHCMIADLSKGTKITVAEAQRDIEAQEAEERYEEGGRSLVLVNHYERKSALRAEAINIHGTRCQGCGLSFEEVYGDHGAGYIEVHHLRPVASYTGSVKVDPRADMAVLCPNCHRMVHHKQESPLSLDELRRILRS